MISFRIYVNGCYAFFLDVQPYQGTRCCIRVTVWKWCTILPIANSLCILDECCRSSLSCSFAVTSSESVEAYLQKSKFLHNCPAEIFIELPDIWLRCCTCELLHSKWWTPGSKTLDHRMMSNMWWGDIRITIWYNQVVEEHVDDLGSCNLSGRYYVSELSVQTSGGNPKLLSGLRIWKLCENVYSTEIQ